MCVKLMYALVGAAFFFGAGAATAQTDPKTTPQQEPSAKQQPSAQQPSTTQEPSAKQEPSTKSDSAMKSETPKLTLTDEQAKSWVDKPVYSSDGNEIGEVAAFKRGTDNAVLELHADIGGMLGIGETRVKLTPEQFSLKGDRVVLKLTEAQAKNLPKVEG